jgi:hypothetical protein
VDPRTKNSGSTRANFARTGSTDVRLPSRDVTTSPPRHSNTAAPPVEAVEDAAGDLTTPAPGSSLGGGGSGVAVGVAGWVEGGGRAHNGLSLPCHLSSPLLRSLSCLPHLRLLLSSIAIFYCNIVILYVLLYPT